MKNTILFILPSLTSSQTKGYRKIKYSRFPPLSLLTLAGMTPQDKYKMIVRDEHVESSDVDEHVDIVAIQTYISSAYRAYELADKYRERGAKIIMGGLHATSLPHEAAQYADAVCIGPAETVWNKILDDFEKGRLCKFYQGECTGSAALVPKPRRDLMNPKAYLLRNTIVTSRGCPHHCDFCYKSTFWGKNYYETRPISKVEEELDDVQDGLVFFLDDNLLANKSYCRQLFHSLKGRGITWQSAASLDVAKDPQYLKEAYESGCRSLFIGFESLSSESMKSVNKNVNAVTDYEEAIRVIHASGIMINSSFVFGFDNDDADIFDRTIEFGIKNKLETASLHILTPLPGTPVFTQMESSGRLLHKNWSLYDVYHAVFQPKRMSPQELEEGHQRTIKEFYSYGSIINRALGTDGALKRMAYNIGLWKVDPLWRAIIKFGLMPHAKEILRGRLLYKNQAQKEKADIYDRIISPSRLQNYNNSTAAA